MPVKQSGQPTLKIEGRIDGAAVEELFKAVAGALEGGKPPVLDMAGVGYVDRAGVQVLRELGEQGVNLVACSSFLETLLNGDGR